MAGVQGMNILVGGNAIIPGELIIILRKKNVSYGEERLRLRKVPDTDRESDVMQRLDTGSGLAHVAQQS